MGTVSLNSGSNDTHFLGAVTRDICHRRNYGTMNLSEYRPGMALGFRVQRVMIICHLSNEMGLQDEERFPPLFGVKSLKDGHWVKGSCFDNLDLLHRFLPKSSTSFCHLETSEKYLLIGECMFMLEFHELTHHVKFLLFHVNYSKNECRGIGKKGEKMIWMALFVRNTRSKWFWEIRRESREYSMMINELLIMTMRYEL